jgi:hypothetical protein
MNSASVHVTKLSAAKRQLQAAIRMHFQPEDELAVHTVASAVYGLLKDIKSSRGLSEAADSFLVSIFYAVRDYRRGDLPRHLANDPVFMSEVERWAEQLSPITADSKLSDVRASIGAELERQYWNDTNKAANFLKHANRDVEQALNLEKVNNDLLLMKCFSAYQDVAPDDLGNEGIVFQAFVCADNESYKIGTSSFDSLVESMKKVPPEHRAHLCHKVILEMNSRE